MPFISEDLWQQIDTLKDGESIMVSAWPELKKYDATYLEQFELFKETTTGIRNIRTDKNLPQKEVLSLMVLPNDESYNNRFDDVLLKLNNLSGITQVTEKPEGAVSFLVKTAEYFIPMEGTIDVEAELAKMREELAYQEGFLKSVMVKLSNERFVDNAPKDVVVKERQKQYDAESKIQSLKEGIARLSK
jgi:valyl-tRNA synthetase